MSKDLARKYLLDAIREAGTSLTVHAGPDGDVLYAVIDEQWAISYATAPDPGLKVPIDSLPLHELGYIVSKGQTMSDAEINITLVAYDLGEQVLPLRRCAMTTTQPKPTISTTWSAVLPR